MGYSMKEEIFCDCCHKQFRNRHDYTMHTQHVGGHALMILCSRVENAKNKSDKLEELYDWFLGDSKFYDEDAINCTLKAMKNNQVHSESDSEDEDDWYCSKPKIAKLLEENIPNLKQRFNNRTLEKIKELTDEFNYKIKDLKNNLI